MMKHMGHNHEIKKNKSTEKLREQYAEFITLSKQILLDYNNQQNITYYNAVYENLFQRLYLGISAIDTLFDKFNQNVYFKHPIAIQMRVCILDSITIAYLSLFVDEGNEREFRNQITRLNQPVARELYNEVKDSNNEDDIKYAMSCFPDNFIQGQTIKINKKIKDLKTADMTTFLREKPLEEFNDIYKLYQHYSKYEHYSIVSKDILKFDTEYEFDSLLYSTFYIFHTAYMGVCYMEVAPDKIESIKRLRDKVDEIEPLFDITNLSLS